jgi:hypothetical protein
MIGFIAPYTFTQFGSTGNTALSLSTNFQFTAAHALGFSVFTSRILATDLSQSHCNFKSQMKSSLQRLILCLPFLLNHLGLPSPELDPIPIPSLLLHFATTVLFSYHSSFGTLISYNPSARTPRKTSCSIIKDACLLVRYLAIDIHFCVRVCCGNVFTDPLPSNGCTRHSTLEPSSV